MSRWQEKYDDHPIHETLRQLIEWSETEAKNPDAELEIERSRLKKVLTLIKTVIAGLDPEIFPEQDVTVVNNHLRHQNFWSPMSEFSQSTTAADLRRSNDHINSILPRVLAISALSAKPAAVEKVKDAEKAFESFAKKVDQSIVEFNEKLKNAEKSFETLSTKTGDLEKKQETFIAESKKTFDKTKEEMETDSKAERDSISEKYNTDFSTRLSNFTQLLNEKTDDVTEKHEAILKLYDIVTGDGIAGGYQSAADTEESSADSWRTIAMCSFIAAALWTGLKFWLYWCEQKTTIAPIPPDWTAIISATSLTVILLSIAAYAASQSRLHRINQQQMKWFSLEIAALGPYIRSLEPEEQRKLRIDLAHRLFAQDRVTIGKRSVQIDKNVFDSLINLIPKVANKSD